MDHQNRTLHGLREPRGETSISAVPGLIADVDVTILIVRGRIRGGWSVLVIAAILAATIWLLYKVWRSGHRNDLATYGAFAVPVITLAAGWVTWTWRARKCFTDQDPSDRRLVQLADQLAIEVTKQWTQAANERGLLAPDPIPVRWGRPSLPVAGPSAAATGSRRFAPLPGLAPAGTAELAAGQISDLHAVYGALGSGRLVIAGPPGSGKTGAAILLILAALQYRRDEVSPENRPEVPVPVLFTAQDWDPDRQPVREWLTRRLQETYSLFSGSPGAMNAAGLIDTGKISVILDGLDEIPAALRPAALQALSQQATFRVVVLARTAEMASAASEHGILYGAAAIELRPVNPSTAADYLQHAQLDPPPDGWAHLLSRIRGHPESALTRSLNSPLTLTLLRDTYQSGDDVRELLDFCDSLHGASKAHASEEITGLLLDRVLPAAYTQRPGQPPPPYDLRTARSALTKIAAQMNHSGTRDLRWWRIPAWAPAGRRCAVAGVVAALAAGLLVVLARVAAGQGTNGIWSHLTLGIEAGLLVGFASRGGFYPHKLVWPWTFLQREPTTPGTWLAFGLMYISMTVGFLILGLLLGLQGWHKTGHAAALAFGISSGILGALLIAFLFMLVGTGRMRHRGTSAPSPAVSWREDRRHGLITGLIFGPAVAFLIWAAESLSWGKPPTPLSGPGLAAPLADALSIGLVIALMGALTIPRAWPSSLAAAQIGIKWHTAAQLMRFLKDAQNRNILRTVGPVYQFRHARLQDRLAAPETTSTPQPDRADKLPYLDNA